MSKQITHELSIHYRSDFSPSGLKTRHYLFTRIMAVRQGDGCLMVEGVCFSIIYRRVLETLLRLPAQRSLIARFAVADLE